MTHIFGKKLVLSSLGIGLVILAVVLANIIAQHLFFRIDLTQERLYTLSDGTKNMLRALPEHVTLKLFYTDSVEGVPPHIATYAQRVQDLLQEYNAHGGADLIIDIFDPAPDSDAQEWAQKYGLHGSLLNPMDPDSLFYFGLVAESLDHVEAIPFLDPQRESFLEYDISRMIYSVTHPERKTVGIFSSLPVTGSPQMPIMLQQQQQHAPWIFVKELEKTFDVESIPTNTTTIAENIDILLIIHPKNLSDETLFAIDQFILRGGNTIAFVDPCSFTDIDADMGFPMPGSSSLNRLFEAYGFTVPENEVVVDLDRATTIATGPNRAECSPVWLSGGKEMVNTDEIMTAGLSSLLLPVAGHIVTNDAASPTLTPLFLSSPNVMTVPPFAAQQSAEQLRAGFSALDTPLILAAHIRDTFATAFPDGPPPSVTHTDDVRTQATRPVSLIVVADVDMLADQFTVQEVNFFGMRGHQPFNNNTHFLMNAINQLSGDENLISLRSRATFRRPFHVVEELERDAQRRWLDHERELAAELQAVQQRLQQLAMQQDESQRLILTPEQQEQIEAFRQRQHEVSRNLRDVRRKLRAEIDALGMRLAFYNIALIPLLVALCGISLALYKNYKGNAS